MRVAWDARPMCARELRGIGHYALNLFPALKALDSDLDIVLFHDGEQPVAPSLAKAARRVGTSRGYRWQLWERLSLPWHAARARCDLLHSLANTTPPYATVPRIVTVHDVIPYLPGFSNGHHLKYHAEVVPAAVRRAALVLTDSECSRQDIGRCFQVPLDNIHVVPLAASPELAPPPVQERRAILQRYGVHAPYLLALGATARRKNTAGVLRVFKRVAAREPALQLVLAGVGSALAPAIDAWMREYAIPDARVTRLPFVDDRELAALYAEAEAFLFLTLYEGFGIPILEAMRCGAPVVCSTRSSCPEVAGDAAAMVDPDDEEAAAELTVQVAHESTSARAGRRARGFARERQFTWRRTAELTAAAYRQVSRG